MLHISSTCSHIPVQKIINFGDLHGASLLTIKHFKNKNKNDSNICLLINQENSDTLSNMQRTFSQDLHWNSCYRVKNCVRTSS